MVTPERTALAPKLRDLGGANLRADLEAPTWVRVMLASKPDAMSVVSRMLSSKWPRGGFLTCEHVQRGGKGTRRV